jgi:hypothetical protein
MRKINWRHSVVRILLYIGMIGFAFLVWRGIISLF